MQRGGFNTPAGVLEARDVGFNMPVLEARDVVDSIRQCLKHAALTVQYNDVRAQRAQGM